MNSFLAATRLPPRYLTSPGAFIRHYVLRRPVGFSGLAFMVTLAAVCAVSVQFVMKLLVDAMSGGPAAIPAAWHALWLFILLIAAESVLWRLSGWLGCRTTIAVGVEMRRDLFAYLSGQPLRFFAERQAGSLGHRITSTAGNFGALVNTVVWRALPPLVDFFGALAVFMLIDWRMTVALALAVFAITGGLIAFGERGRPLHRTYAARANEVNGDLVDVISNMWAVKAFSARQREGERLERAFHGEARAQRASWMYTEKARVIHDLTLWAMAAAMLSWCITLWSTGRITPGDVVLVSALTFRILHGSRDLALSLVDMAQQFGYIEDTLRAIAQPQTVVDPDPSQTMPFGTGDITFKDVTFGYNPGRPALLNITLRIPQGQKIGIVGASGAGKSTLVQLLQRLYDPDVGEICIGGSPLMALEQDTLRKGLAVVPQEVTLFHRSVFDNIHFARPDASRDDVLRAARLAHCDAFIERLPDGLHTIVGERGTKLSGGQRQRIGLARAFLKDAPIVVMDEATSALDTETELLIQRSLSSALAGRTVIAVAHRLSTLSIFDRVIVLTDGQIVEDGAPSRLRLASGPFSRMWRLQSHGALEPAECALDGVPGG